MLKEKVILHKRTDNADYYFSVFIPSWNNLDYLQLCIESIKSHSLLNIQLIVIINEGTDGTREWIEEQKDIDYVYATENIGICYALNTAGIIATAPYVVYLNDDMYVLPGWDVALKSEIETIGHPNFMLSATMIEPTETGNQCVIVKHYGTDVSSFQEKELLDTFPKLKKQDWNGSTWPPVVMHRHVWNMVGGMSIEFSPGFYSDPDLSRKLWELGIRIFKGSGKSLVYHFGTRTTGRVKLNNGRKMFLLKWGLTAHTFMKKYLRIGTPYTGELKEPNLNSIDHLKSKFKKLI